MSEADGLALRTLRLTGDLLARIPRPVSAVLAVAWGAWLWLLSSGAPPDVPHTTPWTYLMNLAHAPLFGVLALLLALTLPRSTARGWPDLTSQRQLAVLVCVGLYGVIDEWHQSFTPGRESTWKDVLTDLVGAAVTLAVASYLARGTATQGGLGWRMTGGLLVCGAAAWVAVAG